MNWNFLAKTRGKTDEQSANTTEAEQANQLTDAGREELEKLRDIYDALDRSQAIIEFEPDGTILSANENFLKTLGYTLKEIVGEHHRMFVDPVYASGEEYAQFWQSLRNGEFQSAEYQRYGKGNREIWIQATYNPVRDEDGNVVKVIKFAVDISKQKHAVIDAVNKTQAFIEFLPDGTIVNANSKFLSAVGYTLDEIKGQHHRMFCDPEWVSQPSYEGFWRSLRQGNFQQGQYQRFAKGGREIWIQATYNPEFDSSGAVRRVVKYASDITDQIATKKRASDVGEYVATSVQEMSSSIDEITRNITRTASLAQEAKNGAAASTEIVAKLESGSIDIGTVVSLIQDLADQTNLLALNANIEAARAGESGRGFAVVANEVKELASETTRATNSIADSITDIQTNVSAVVEAIRALSRNANEVSENASSVAAAVEEQSTLMSGLSERSEELLSITS